MTVTSEPAEEVNYAATALTLVILTTRIILWLCRRERIDASFVLVSASILAVIARIATNFYYLKYGTASDAIRHADYFDEGNLRDVRTGSILVLVARVLITTILWLQVCILLLFYSGITSGIGWIPWMVKIAWAAVVATFLAVVLVTLLECRPISLYWQIMPDPGYCVRAYAQLLTQTISNITLDLLLIVIAWPIIGLRKRTLAQHITLYTLFALGTFCIVISVIRVVSVHISGSSQVIRSLWASVQMLVSTFVANAPNIYGSIRALRTKKPGPHSGTFAYDHVYDPAATVRTNRVRPVYRSWMSAEESVYIALTSNPQSYILPLPPATTFYDDRTAPAPYSHQTSHEDGAVIHRESSGLHAVVTPSRTRQPERRPY